MDVTNVAIDKVIPYARNPRKNDKAIPRVAASLKEFGWQQPIVVDKDYIVIVGHTRLEAARSLGMTEVPILVADKLTPQQVKAYRIADNKTAEYSEFDYELLILELEELQEQLYDTSLTGFEDKDLVKMLDFSADKNTAPNDIPTVVEEPVSKLGQLYKLGNHRLLCGSATEQQDYKTLLGENVAQMVWTDPPYNVNYTGGTPQPGGVGGNFREPIANDNMDDQSFYEFLYNTFINVYEFLGKGSPFYICHDPSSALQILQALQESKMSVRQQLVWIKNYPVISRQDYNWSHEAILYGWKEESAHKWYGGYQTSTTIDDRPDFNKLTKEQLIQYIKDIPIDIFDVDRPHKSDLHPTMKPVELIEPMLVNSSSQGDIVLEPFAGSGSTLIACESINRRCYAIELDPHYVDVIIQRWENYTGNKAELIDDRT